MPFSDEYQEVYAVIKDASQAVGYECSRADLSYGPGNAVRDLIHNIFNADVIVADLSESNPNVFYELGIAHSIANKTVMICDSNFRRLAFDLAAYRTEFYDRRKLMALLPFLKRTLADVDQWQSRPTNPVQDFRTIDYTVPLSSQAVLEQKVRTLEGENAHLRLLSRGRARVGSMVLIPSGSFLMGAEGCGPIATPIHEVHTDAFLIDVYPVTNGEFQQFLGACPGWRRNHGIDRHKNIYYLFLWNDNRCGHCGARQPRGYKTGDLCPACGKQPEPLHAYPVGRKDHPVVWVNWFAAAEYCNWRSRSKGLRPAYDERYECSFEANGYRLPTEAEFEKAMRGGRGGLDRAAYPWGDDVDESRANYGNITKGTTDVGNYDPNDYGLFDVSGNVKHWCNDWFDERCYGPSRRTNPTGPESGPFKVFRGGSWGDDARALRCGYRGWLLPPNTNPDLGFRCVQRP
jgi:formylglycine-generating enzyme required for sulfatase activity